MYKYVTHFIICHETYNKEDLIEGWPRSTEICVSISRPALCPSSAPKACLALPGPVLRERGRQGPNRVQAVRQDPSDEAAARWSSEVHAGTEASQTQPSDPGQACGNEAGQDQAAEWVQGGGIMEGQAVTGKRHLSEGAWARSDGAGPWAGCAWGQVRLGRAPSVCWQLSRQGGTVWARAVKNSSLLVMTQEGIAAGTLEGCHGTAGLIQHLLCAQMHSKGKHFKSRYQEMFW